jgi:hypothetical protein
LDGVDRLADRTRWIYNTITGNSAGVPENLLTVPATLTQYVTVPDDTRLTASNAFRAIAKPLLQNFKWLKESLPGKALGSTVVGFFPRPIHSSAWSSVSSGGGTFNFVQTGNSSSDIALFQLPVTIRAGTLITVTAHVLGDVAGGNVHGGSKPANMPRIDLYRYVSTGSGLSSALVGGQADTSATAVIYDAAHGIQLNVVESIAPSSTMFWALKITGESGANSLANALTLQWIDMTIDGGSL